MRINLDEVWTVELDGHDEYHRYYCDNPESAITMACIVAEHQGFGTHQIESVLQHGMSILTVKKETLTIRDNLSNIVITIDRP